MNEICITLGYLSSIKLNFNEMNKMRFLGMGIGEGGEWLGFFGGLMRLL